MGDELLGMMVPLFVGSSRIRIIKLAKNKISDVGALNLFSALI